MMKHRLHQQERRQQQGAAAASNIRHERGAGGATSGPSRFGSSTHKLSAFIHQFFTTVFPWLVGGMAVVGVIVMMTPRTGTMQISDDAWVSSSADGISEQSDPLVDQLSEPSVPEELTQDLIQRTEQAEAPADAVSDPGINPADNQTGIDTTAALGNGLASDTPEQEVITASGDVSRLERLPVPAAGEDSVIAPDGGETAKPGDTVSNTPIAKTYPPPVATKTPTPETVRKGGPWVINLASVANKKNAESFIAQAKSRGVNAELSQVTVKGKKRWRVHVSGFATDAEARAEARVIKEKLGIDDAWIAKR